jgi:cytoskeletal protein RodZ
MPETLGQSLQTARLEKKLSLEQASEATHIRQHYLQALEADDYSGMPSAPQARGFLRNYASFLGLDLETLLPTIKANPAGASEEMSGPLPQVEVAPLPPEPVTTRRAAELPERPMADTLRSALASRRQASIDTPTESGRVEETEGGAEPAQDQAVSESLPSESAPVGEARSGRLGRFRSFFGQKEKPDEEITPIRLEPGDAAEAERLAKIPIETVPTDEVNGESPEQIFREIGTQLRKRRELLSLTPDEVERHIHIRGAFLQALEAGDFQQLPSAVQTRGMLANYAAFLDLDADAVLLRFADALQAEHRLRHPEPPGRSRKPASTVRPNIPPLRGFVAGDVIFGVAVVVMVVALVVWGLGRVFAVPATPVFLPTAPSISDVLAGTDMPTPVQEVTLIAGFDSPLSPAGDTATPEATLEATLEPPPINANVAVALTIVATERTFMRVTVDGEEAFNGRVLAGTAYTYEATTSIEVLTGNGAALRVTYNGRDMGLMGEFGEVAQYVYTANAVVTPLPAASPTGTATLPISPTPTTTSTPTPTATLPPGG